MLWSLHVTLFNYYGTLFYFIYLFFLEPFFILTISISYT